MIQWWIVAKKEIIDNFRDKRAFFFALVYGPVIMPLLIVGPMLLGAKSGFIDYEQPVEVYVAGMEHAPNLMAYLASKNLTAKAAPDHYRNKVRLGELDAVLEIPETHALSFREGKPSPLFLYVNYSSKKSGKAARHIKSIMNGYSRQLGYWRMRARGLDYQIMEPLKLVEQDLSHDGFGGMIFGTLIYFVLVFTMVMGGFYLAVDSTAGERERNSIEPLLALPISRFSIVLGKYVATLGYVTLSGLLATISLYLLFNLVPLGDLSQFLNLNGAALFMAFLIAQPCAVCVASLLMAVAAFTRTPKEAQTYLGLLALMPMIPVGVNQFADVKIAVWQMLIPFLSQSTLIDKVFKNEVVSGQFLVASVVGTLLFSFALFWVAVQLYRREKIVL